jgi:hypothetical protein
MTSVSANPYYTFFMSTICFVEDIFFSLFSVSLTDTKTPNLTAYLDTFFSLMDLEYGADDARGGTHGRIQHVHVLRRCVHLLRLAIPTSRTYSKLPLITQFPIPIELSNKNTTISSLRLCDNTYILLTLYPQRNNRGISDIPPRHPHFTKITCPCSSY